MKTQTENKIIEIDIKDIVGLENEERDFSVNYYCPFCLYGKDIKGNDINIYFDYDNLLKIKCLLDEKIKNDIL